MKIYCQKFFFSIIVPAHARGARREKGIEHVMVSLYGFICDKLCPVMTAQREKDIHINPVIVYRKIDSFGRVAGIFLVLERLRSGERQNSRNIDDNDDTNDDYESPELRNYSVICIARTSDHRIQFLQSRRSP